jgi:ribosome-associated translation inhibitor RaiA
MNIEISTSETSATLAERDYIYHRLQNALSEHEAQITQAQVWIVGIVCADAQDAQYALINVKLDDGNLIACDGTDADLKTAINYATQRLCLEVTRNRRGANRSRCALVSQCRGNRLPARNHLSEHP